MASSTRSSGARPVVAASSLRRDSVSGLRCTTITASLETRSEPVKAINSMYRMLRVSLFIEVRLAARLRANPFVAQPNRSVRVGLAFCQPEVALREFGGKAGNAIAQ